MHDLQRRPHRVTRHEHPATLVDAFGLLDRYQSAARAIAGGTDLLLEFARRSRTDTEVLVDLAPIPGLDRIDVRDGLIHIGPLVTHNDVIACGAIVRGALPLAQACLEVGAPALRNRATVVGNVVTASSANDTISALRALGATIVIDSSRGERRVPIAAFYLGARRTVLQPSELVTGIEVPVLRSDQRGLFVKLGQRRAQAISVVHAAVVATIEDDVVTECTIALGSVAATVVTASDAQRFVVGKPLTDDVIAATARLASEGVQPISDVRATAEYRSDLVAVLIRRAFTALRDNRQADCWPIRTLLLCCDPVVTAPARSGLTVTSETIIQTSINGKPFQAAHAGGETLLNWLRDEAGLSGTKEGCAEGECGACTVNLDGRAALSCLVPASAAHGATITTIEGLAHRGLHRIQQAFIDQFAVQCGYCIPGFIMASERLLSECPRPDRALIEQGLSGNLCRCTGYYRFYDALEQASSTTP